MDVDGDSSPLDKTTLQSTSPFKKEVSLFLKAIKQAMAGGHG